MSMKSVAAIIMGILLAAPTARAQDTIQVQRQIKILGDALDYRELEVRELQRRLGELDSYLKACGDKPGCTVPVMEAGKPGVASPK